MTDRGVSGGVGIHRDVAFSLAMGSALSQSNLDLVKCSGCLWLAQSYMCSFKGVCNKYTAWKGKWGHIGENKRDTNVRNIIWFIEIGKQCLLHRIISISKKHCASINDLYNNKSSCC